MSTNSVKPIRMVESEEQSMNYYPPELLMHLFSFLKPKHLATCRRVCRRWRDIVDALFRNECLWNRHCQYDFPDIYEAAYYKTRRELSWCTIYRSLSMWPKVHKAIEICEDFANASSPATEIRDFQILRNGEIGVHTRLGIFYYNLRTLEKLKGECILGDYIRYEETDNVILVLGFTLHLYITRKYVMDNEKYEGCFQAVKNFLVNYNELYYVTLDNKIYFCNLQKDEFKSELLIQIPDSIMCVGFKNGHLHALTYQRDIYSIVGKKLVFQCTLNSSPNLLHVLKKYNFLERLDWRVYFQWMFVLNHSIPQGSIRDIIVVKIYGDVAFVGCNSGVFRIYYAPYSKDDEFDLFNTKPVKQYDFRESNTLLPDCAIIQIDIIEDYNRHIVFVGMPKKIAILNFVYEMEKSSNSYEMLQTVQFVKIVDREPMELI